MKINNNFINENKILIKFNFTDQRKETPKQLVVTDNL